MKRKLIMSLMILIALMGCSTSQEEKVTVHIGYQSVTAQTWGALVIKNQGLFEKHLQEKMPGTTVTVEWHDELSGAIINNNMLSGKYQIGFMGDMPLLINGYTGQTQPNYKSELIAFDGKGENGKNQAVVVKEDSSIKVVEDLKGKTVSVPVGSSAHRMLLKILKEHHILDEVTLIHQDISIGISTLESGKVDAFAGWDPYPKILTDKNSGRILADGSESTSDYLAGIAVNKDWANQNEEIVEAFIESLLEAHEFIRSSPDKAATIFAEESKFPESITRQEVTNIRWEATINEKDKETLKNGLDFLSDIGKIQTYDLNKFIQTKYYDAVLDRAK